MFFFTFLFKDLLEVLCSYVVFFTMSLISTFLLSKTRLVGVECSFTYRYYSFKNHCFYYHLILLHYLLYQDSSLTNNSLSTCYYMTRYKLSSHLLFIYYFANKFSHTGFETSLMQLCKHLIDKFVLILLHNNFFSSGIPPIHKLIISPITLLP
jgi:hypothetical protein